jgi:hypothetical protein
MYRVSERKRRHWRYLREKTLEFIEARICSAVIRFSLGEISREELHEMTGDESRLLFASVEPSPWFELRVKFEDNG